MGALPKQRITRAKQGFRRQHDKLRAPLLMVCPQCREMKRQHHVCPNCGYYAGRQVIEIADERPRAGQQ
jgi:large subunit ribosomal protein L32